MHGTSAVLLCLGSIAMLSDAFGTREDWLHGMILDLMNPTNSNHYIYKDTFLGNMYRIVSIQANSELQSIANIEP